MKNKKPFIFILAVFVLFMIFAIFSDKTKEYRDPMGNEYTLQELEDNVLCEKSVDGVFICREDCTKPENKNIRYCKA